MLKNGLRSCWPDSRYPACCTAAQLSQEDARTPALWHAERLSLSPNSLSNEQDPRNRASVFALAAGPSFLPCLCDTFWGADGHLAALIGTCSYGLGANRSSVFVTGAPGSGKTRSCAFLGILVACLTNRLTLYTAHGNESARAYIEAVDRLTAASHDFVRSRIIRVPASKEKDTQSGLVQRSVFQVVCLFDFGCIYSKISGFVLGLLELDVAARACSSLLAALKIFVAVTTLGRPSFGLL